MADRFKESVEQRWDYWKNHELVVVEEGARVQSYYLKHPRQELRIEGCLLLFSPEGVVITGDYVPGDKHSVSSPFGYSREWFAKDLSPSYLASKFLKEKWQSKFAAEELRQILEEEEQEGNPSKLAIIGLYHVADELVNELDDSGLTEEYFYEKLVEGGWDTSDGIPGYDYDPNEYSLLIAIQRRFAEVWKEHQLKTEYYTKLRNQLRSALGAVERVLLESTRRPSPRFTVLYNIVSPESSKWVGTGWEFFDKEEDAKKCYQRQIENGNCPCRRYFSEKPDRQHMGAAHRF